MPRLWFAVGIVAVSICGTAWGQGLPFVPDDLLYGDQWHLDKQATSAAIDANVAAAWARGWTGQGVLIGIVDQVQIEATHPDLQPNYRADVGMAVGTTIASDGNAQINGVAGVAAGRGGNGGGITGAAPLATFSPLEFSYTNFDAGITAAANHRNDVFDIKNYSVATVVEFVRNANYEQAIKTSEAAGVINVRAAGNTRSNVGIYGDKNFRGQILIGGVSSFGDKYEFSSFGSNLAATAPTLGLVGGLGITTTTTTALGSYQSGFGDTSAATALASGVLALVKEAQPRLDTRFAMHLLARTSRIVDATDNIYFRRTIDQGLLPNTSTMTPFGFWRTNAAGIHFNNEYGFGLIDAAALVDAAQEFTGVTPATTHATGTLAVGLPVPEDSFLSRQFTLGDIGALEDIQLDFRIEGRFKSAIEILLTSPAGTVSLLHNATINPDSMGSAGSRDWTYISNAFWGEQAAGVWTLTLRDLPWVQQYEAADTVSLTSFAVTARAGTLIPAADGDFDADGDVDGFDFLKWQRTFDSAINLAADDSGNGSIDDADLMSWRAHLGETGSASGAAVPEPSAVILAFLSATIICPYCLLVTSQNRRPPL